MFSNRAFAPVAAILVLAASLVRLPACKSGDEKAAEPMPQPVKAPDIQAQLAKFAFP